MTCYPVPQPIFKFHADIFQSFVGFFRSMRMEGPNNVALSLRAFVSHAQGSQVK